MRVGFDTSPLARPHPRGVVRAVEGAVTALEARGNVEVVRLEPNGSDPLRAWRHKRLAGEVERQGLAGIHSFVSAFAWRGPGLRVQTVHELPWRHGVRENADWRHRAWAALGPGKAAATVCPSEFVANELRRSRGLGRGKVRVVPWGIGAPFQDEPELGAVDEQVLGHYRLGEDPLLLCLGAVRAKKNLAAVLHGLAEYVRRGGKRVQLVVSGEDTPQLRRDLGTVSKLGLARFVSTPGVLAEEHMPALLRLATAVCVLSHSEGFSFPTLEALACGTPPVVSQGSAQAELAGTAGITVDPAQPESVADGLERAIDEREERRYTCSDRAAEYSWERCAEGIESLWRELA